MANQRIVSEASLIVSVSLIVMLVFDTQSVTGQNDASIDASVQVQHNIESLGPLVTLSSTAKDIPVGSTDVLLKWVFGEITLSEKRMDQQHAQLVNADPSRYVVTSLTELSFNMTIRNAIKADEGAYRILLMLTRDGDMKPTQISQTVDVIIDSYLPPLGFPRCSIEPGNMTTVPSDVNVNFICEPGGSKPPVILQLALAMQDVASNEPLGNMSTTRQVTTSDNNTTFVCIMTSDTFRTARRMCSFGPISVLPLPPSTPMTIIDETSKTLVASNSPVEISDSTDPSAGTSDGLGTIIGGTVGAIIAALIIIVVAFKFVRAKSHKTSNGSLDNGRMVDMEATASPKPRPTISQPIGEVAFSRPSIDLTDPNSIILDPDNAFANNAVNVTDEATASDVPSGSQDQDVDLYHDADEAKLRATKPISNGHAANKYEDAAPGVYEPSLNNDQTVPAHPSTNELESAKIEESSPAHVMPVYGKVNKDRNTVHSENATEIAQHKTDPVIYESADELDLENNASESAKPFSAVRPPHLYDRVKDSKSDLDVVGANHQEVNSGYASADEIDAHCRVPPVASQPPANDKVNTGYENVPNNATGLSKKQNGTQEPGDDPPYESTNDIDLDKTTAPRKTLATSETPVYGKVNKNTIKTDDNDTASASYLPNAEDRGGPVDADTEEIDENASGETPASEPPVYSEVNKGHKEDPDNKGRESEGFVENIIYVSSGSAPESQA